MHDKHIHEEYSILLSCLLSLDSGSSLTEWLEWLVFYSNIT